MNRTARFFNVIYFVVALLGVWLLQQAWMRSQTVAPIPYSEFQTLLKAGKVEEVSIGQDQLTGKLREPLRFSGALKVIQAMAHP
jgi:cell division protease FtsH